MLMTNSWLFPPQTSEVQFDEKWSFVGKKQMNCNPLNPADDHKGDWWDHVAFDPEHKLVLAVVPGARVTESVEEVVAEVKDRTGQKPPRLITSDGVPRLRIRYRGGLRHTHAACVRTGMPADPPGTSAPGEAELCHGPQRA